VEVPDGTDRLTILDGVDLRIGAGEVVMITGGSGSGKSTLLSVAALLRRPSSGEVHVDGAPTASMSDKQLATTRSLHLGIVFQTSNLFPSLTALQQVELAAHIAGHLDSNATEQARALLESVELGQAMNRLPKQLSGGERQRVGIARALMNEPAIILADEPTASLDESRGQRVMDLLVAETRRRGTAAMIVTHAPDQLRDADRHFHLTGGRLELVTSRSS
jgi:putative ABC transport system ATP-binding protein